MEERRGARVATTFLVAIEGVDRAPEPRQGDISQTGIYFETTADVGPTGTIHWLHLVSVDNVRQVRVMAYVVRSATRGKLRGAAFEFMPESDDSFGALQTFVKYSLGLRSMAALDPHISSPRLEAAATSSGSMVAAREAVIGKLSVRSMVLETSWAVSPGESLRVDIAAPGMTRRIRLEGKAVRVAPSPGKSHTFTIEVEVQEESDRPLAHSSMSFTKVVPPAAPAPSKAEPSPSSYDENLRTLDDLLSSLILAPSDEARRQRAHHLSGQLASVPLTTLIALFEMERLTGELVVRRDIEEARIYISGGRLVDVEPVAVGETGRARVRSILGWREGSFEFDVQPVGRADKIGMSTTALLIDLAREDDEASRPSG
jgi:hypothetical protein